MRFVVLDPRRRAPMIVAMLLALVAAAGCGSASSSSSSSASSSSTSTNAATPAAATQSTPLTKSPVLVGLQTSFGNPVDSHPYTLPVAEAAVRAVNANGGLSGHPVKLVSCNDQASTGQAMSCARTLVADHIAACVGCHSLYDNLVQPILGQAKIPMIAQQAISAQTFNGSNMYQPQGGAIIADQAMIGYAHSKGGKLGIAFADVPAGQGFEQLLEATLKAAGGSGFSTKVPVPPTTSDFSSLAALAVGGGTTKLVMALDNAQYVPLMKAIAGGGAGISDYYTLNLNSQSYVNSLGPLADNLIVGASFPPLSSPLMAPFVHDMKTYGGPPLDNIVVENDSLPWVALQVLAKISKGMNTINAATISAALDKAKDINIGPMLPPWTPSNPGPKGFSRISNPYAWIEGYKNGTTVLLVNQPVSVSNALAGKF
jgi:branched-chain amino acid transport system substrate-binding protein